MRLLPLVAAAWLAGARPCAAIEAPPVIVPGTFIEPTAHIEAARTAAAQDGLLIAAIADLRKPSQGWTYVLHSRERNELIHVSADAAGRTKVLHRMSTWDTFVPWPIDLKSGMISLAKAREAVERLGAAFSGVFITRSFSQRRPIFRFDGGAESDAIVDGETGELVGRGLKREQKL